MRKFHNYKLQTCFTPRISKLFLFFAILVQASFVNAQLITNISATSGRTYALSQLIESTTIYTDRGYQATAVPGFLNNASFIRTANDDKSSKTTSLLSFNLTQSATVYVGYDPRAATLPAWLSSWQKLSSQLGINDSKIDHLDIYSKGFPGGTVSLGGNLASPAAGAQNMYVVMALPEYSLAVNVTGSGSVTKNPNQPGYLTGTSVTLTAVPSAGQQFTGWSGDATGTTNPLSVAMDANKSIMATFSPVSPTQYTLEINVNGNGSVSKSPDQAAYNEGTSVSLTATSAAGQQFTGWGGDATGTTNPLNVIMSANKSITATFAPVAPAQYTLTVGVSGNGSVSKNPDQATYDNGTNVSLTATPAAGQQFTGWSGDASTTTNPLSVTVNSNKNITANFLPVSSALITNITATSGRNYVLSTLAVGVTFFSDRTYQITSVPGFLNNASFIKTPNDDKTSTATSLLSFNLTQSATIFVVYDTRGTTLPSWLNGWQKLSYLVGINDPKVSFMDIYCKNFAAGNVTFGGNLASPAAGALNNYFVVALSQSSQFNLTTSLSGSGSVTKNPNLATYPNGINVTLTAAPGNGQQFTGWSGDASGFVNPLSLTMSSNKSITASFASSSALPNITVSPRTIYDNDVSGGTAGINRTIKIKNNGSGVLSVSSVAMSGTNANQFVLSGLPAFPVNINVGDSISFSAAFNPSSAGLKIASVIINSNDPSNPVSSVSLRGLGTAGLGGTNEPSLQALFDLLEIPIGVGDDNVSTTIINSNTTFQKAPLLGEEVSIDKFKKADAGNITITPLAVFGPTTNATILGLGWYKSGNASSKSELFTVSNNPLSNGQAVNVNYSGTLLFDPASTDTFGFYVRWPAFNDRQMYSEDNLNIFSGAIPHHSRVYVYKDSTGVVPNAYVVTFEDNTSGFDYQDIIFIVRNVKSATSVNGPLTVALNPVADAYVRNGSYAAMNFGSDTSLLVKGSTSSGFNRTSYLKFSLNAINNIRSAKLRIYGKNSESTATVSLSLYDVANDSWTENGITNNNAPSASSTPLGLVSVNSQEKYYEFDVTNNVRDEAAGDKIISFMLKDAANKNLTLSFKSKEKGQNMPELVVDTTPVTISTASLYVENLDKFPSNEDFVFSRLEIPWSRDTLHYNSNHDSLKVRIHNKGINPLVIKSLTLSNDTTWQILKINNTNYNSTSHLPLPVGVNSGSFVDITLKFIAHNQASRVKILHEILTVESNDDKYPLKQINLHGIWQQIGEGSNEPYAQEIINAFGYTSKVGFAHTDPDKGDSTKLKGDEIKPSYFVRANPALPVSIRQMSAYHGCCTSTERIMWFAKGSTTLNTVFTHIDDDGQSALPRKALPGTPAEGTFNPTTPFGFKIGNNDWTDATKTPGTKIGIRVWKAFDSKGNIIPNAYIISNDYLGSDATNYDYNDNTHFITNIKPAIGTAYFSTLAVTPSALDFAQDDLLVTDSLTLNIKNNGLIYSGGPSDPNVVISSVQIVGENKSEFSVDMPLNSNLAPQQTSTIKVKFKPTSQGLKIADLLIYYNNSFSPHRVPLYGIAKSSGTAVTLNYRIKSGSSTAITVNGKTWSADTPYAFDNLEPFTNTNVSQVAGTDEDSVYLKEQSSNGDKKPFRYEMTVPNGDYTVRLHFAEIYWGSLGSGLSGGAGSRVMSVQIENQLRLINLDVLQEVGAATALVKNFPVTVTDGKLNIDFSATVNRPMICGVEVYSFSPSARSAIQPVVSSSDDAVDPINLAQSKVYPNPLHNKFTIEFPVNYRGNFTSEIVDIVGRKYEISKTKLKEGGSIIQVDISKLNLTPGVYLLRINSDAGKTEVHKLIVK
jgi:uncharacterized repeat protein (TIGR02543 family)